MSDAQLIWTDDARERLRSLLAEANGRRAARVLSFEELEQCAVAALSAPVGFVWASAGEAPDARAMTTVCLAAVRDKKLTISVGAAHGAANPSSAWSDLSEWDHYEPAANRPSVLAWAGRRRDDRVQLDVSWPKIEVTSSREALLTRVLEAPDDDGARLVYADFLSEQGDPRGEFIALQCAPQTEATRVRAAALLEEHGSTWLKHTSALAVNYARGFVADVRCFSPDALSELEGVLGDEPVEHLTLLSTRQFDVATISTWPEVARLRSLSLQLLSGNALADGVVTLEALATTRWSSLRALSLRSQRIGDEGFHLLSEIAARAFPALNA